MKTLIVSATYNEISILVEKLSLKSESEFLFVSDKVDVLITGIGGAFTVYRLSEHLQNNIYSLIISVGIAGSYKKSIKIGDVVNVSSDCFADLGVDDNGKFKTLSEANLISERINLQFAKNSYFNTIQSVKAITVNTSSGSKETIAKLETKFNPDIETMEGASVVFVANNKKIQVIQIRAISNFVEPRNKDNWNIKLAISNLNKLLLDYYR